MKEWWVGGDRTWKERAIECQGMRKDACPAIGSGRKQGDRKKGGFRIHCEEQGVLRGGARGLSRGHILQRLIRDLDLTPKTV